MERDNAALLSISYPPSAFSSIYFVGVFNSKEDLPKNAKAGTAAVLVSNKDIIWIYDGKDWVDIGGANDLDSPRDEPVNRAARKLRNCRNCGAPAGWKDHCDYCGSLLLEYE